MAKDIRWKWLEERGIRIDDELQKQYLEDIWNPKVQIVFNDSPAGTGKTTIPVLALMYEVEKGEKYDQLLYVRSAVPVRELGYLGGDLQAKEHPYFSPFIDTLDKIQYGYYDKWSKTSFENKEPKVIAVTTSYLRGISWSRKAIIFDEVQNFSLTELRTVLTRPHDDCKVVVTGSSRQIDNRKDMIQGKTAFEMYMEYFKKYPRATFHTLTKNYRGSLATFADDFIIPDGILSK